MAKLNDALMLEILSQDLPEGETITHCAYGIKQPNMLLMLPAFALAVLPGVILTQVLTKHYVIGLSQSRVIVVQVKPKWSTLSVAVDAVVTSTYQDLAALKGTEVKNKTGALFTNLAFSTLAGPFKAKSHRAFSKSNRPSAMAIGEAVAAAA